MKRSSHSPDAHVRRRIFAPQPRVVANLVSPTWRQTPPRRRKTLSANTYQDSQVGGFVQLFTLPATNEHSFLFPSPPQAFQKIRVHLVGVGFAMGKLKFWKQKSSNQLTFGSNPN